jgi:hypothetical protein
MDTFLNVVVWICVACLFITFALNLGLAAMSQRLVREFDGPDSATFRSRRNADFMRAGVNIAPAALILSLAAWGGLHWHIMTACVVVLAATNRIDDRISKRYGAQPKNA